MLQNLVKYLYIKLKVQHAERWLRDNMFLQLERKIHILIVIPLQNLYFPKVTYRNEILNNVF